ncbi:MAG: recombinase family protein [Lachnospiraceae bacterium]|nr:recombinase family protein [Lachnospiraceae bacterium]
METVRQTFCADTISTPPRVAAYIRVSTDSREQEDSYELQEEYFTTLLSQNPTWISAGVYSDYGLSGTSTYKRFGFQRLLRHCKEGKINRIITKSISRFARNTKDFMEAFHILREHHVSILFEKEHLDTASFFNDFIVTTLSAISQEQSRSISDNLVWSIQKRYRSGDSPNFAIYGYRFVPGKEGIAVSQTGYRYRKLETAPEEAAVIQYIFTAAAAGISYIQIARNLNFRHIPAPARHTSSLPKIGKLKKGLCLGWTGPMIGQMLRLERYSGDALLQKTYTTDHINHTVKRNKGERAQYLVRNHHPAIIDRRLFQEVQLLIIKNKNYRQNNPDTHKKYPFSQRLICAHCGRYYFTRNRNSNPIWYCPTSGLNNGLRICHSERIYEEQLMRMLRKAIAERYSLIKTPIYDKIETSDVLNGFFENRFFNQTALSFLGEMQKRLRYVQEKDDFEQAYTLKKHQLLAALSDHHYLRRQSDHSPLPSKTLDAMEQREKELSESLLCLEQYWKILEKDYEWRKKALLWMATLPPGKKGVSQFLNGLTTEYVKAFVLSITVYDPLHYKVHWFDNSKTLVEMYSNIEDYRMTATYLAKNRRS